MESQYWLGYMHERGRGVKANLVEAHRWYHIATETGDRPAELDHSANEKKLTVDQMEEAHDRAAKWWVTYMTVSEDGPLRPGKNAFGP